MQLVHRPAEVARATCAAAWLRIDRYVNPDAALTTEIKLKQNQNKIMFGPPGNPGGATGAKLVSTNAGIFCWWFRVVD